MRSSDFLTGKLIPGQHFDAGGAKTERGAVREAIARATRLPEAQALQPLLALASMPAEMAQRTKDIALKLVQGLRSGATQGGRAGRVQSLMQEYALSSEEGVSLMCLAEALLRIPDAATRDALIRDKIGQGNWQQHLGRSDSLFVNAASWGLLVTGKLVATHSETSLSNSLKRLVAKGGEPVIRKSVDLAMRMLGEQFVTGETIGQALKRAKEMESRGFTYSYDMLGEAALTAQDAQRYYTAYEQAIHAIGQAAHGNSVIERAGISIKLSALHPRYSRAQHTRVMLELYPRVLALTELAKRYNIGLNIDAEESERLEISLDLLEALCHAPSLAGWDGIGFVIQAYQKRCPYVIDFVIDLAKRSQHRLMIRLVKGAYWDSEIKRAQIDGQSDYPVYTRKHHSDVSYAACARKLLAAPKAVYPQFATHNAQTLASIVEFAQAQLGDYAPGQYEFQCLHGMGEPLYWQVVGADKLNRPCRIYAPVGTHETLLAYLVRRLLENGANSSFVNRMADETVSIDDLVKDPVTRMHEDVATEGCELGSPHPHIALPAALYGVARLNSSGIDLADEPTLRDLVQQMQASTRFEPGLAAEFQSDLQVTPMLAGAVQGAAVLNIVNPADHSDRIGSVQQASPEDVQAALQASHDYASIWAAVPVAQRAAILEQAANLLQADMPQCIALLVREAGKTWAHGVAEVREAIDFLRYYAAQVRREFDSSTYQPLGSVVCISPWNFPLAIFLGQVAAALAAGNTVLAKPAESTPAIAAHAVKLLWQAGVPRPAVQLLTGQGREIGMQMIADARVQGVMFTGSTATARVLQKTLTQRLNAHGQTVALIAETGGQNCMVVDSSALLEQVVQDAVDSAFGAAGQRCSALRVLCVQEEAADRLLEMLQGAMREIRVGTPSQLQTDVGPVIDARAQNGIEAHIAAMQAKGRQVHRLRHPDSRNDNGTYVIPTLIQIDNLSELTQEIFGPVLHVLRYRREALGQLLSDINATGYALTMGLHSRIEETIEQVIQSSHAGNVYVNRNMVGAVVGLQPFGGEGLSGTGPKAGGPLYLLRLLAKSPQEAALRNLQSSGAAALPQATPALQALHDWAVAEQQLSLAHLCADFAANSPANLLALLPGPTGERNVYQVQARERVLCMTGRQPSEKQDLLNQLAAVLAVGGRAIWPLQAKALYNSLPPVVQSKIECCELKAPLHVDAALMHGDEASSLQMAQMLSAQEGAIISLTVLRPGDQNIPLARLVCERSISTNTAAAGGNASLMTLQA